MFPGRLVCCARNEPKPHRDRQQARHDRNRPTDSGPRQSISTGPRQRAGRCGACGVRVEQHRPPPRLVNSGTNRPTSGLAEGRSVDSVPVNSANWPTKARQNFFWPHWRHATCCRPGSAVTLLRGAAAEQQELKDHLDRPRARGYSCPPSSPRTPLESHPSLPSCTDKMLSSLRIASRRAAVARNFTAVRAASSWANVPQGPPVRLRDSNLTPVVRRLD